MSYAISQKPKCLLKIKLPHISDLNINKKITHMQRRWDTPQNFFLAFIDEFEKQVIIKKTVEVGQ